MNNERLIFLKDAPSSDQMPARVIYGAREECPPPVHWHENVEINFMVRGSWYINIDGQKKYIDRMHAEIVNSGAVHWITPVKRAAHDNLVIVFYLDFLRQYQPDIEDFTFRLPGQEEAEAPIYTYLCRIYEIYRADQSAGRISRQDAAQYQAGELEIRGLLYAIAYELLGTCKVRKQQKDRHQNSRYQERFKSACQFIEEHYHEDIGLRELAEELAISKEHCSRSFRDYLGISFKEYLTNVRLGHAYRLLICSELPISEIAMRTGFADIRAFDRSFSCRYNETPSVWRKRMKQEGSESHVLSGRATQI